ncbi:MAG: hypothetical protein QOF61_2475 [Acidobacteriota bacterium]|jgi:hypothetical protein|nr:hypothetical protein [Acidobacteriota bacterium]
MTAMPNLGVTDADARDVASYLDTLKRRRRHFETAAKTLNMRATDHNSTRDVRRRARVVCVLATLSLFAACAQADPQKEIRQEAQTLASWAATLHLVGDSWREGSVPGRYAEKTISEVREALREEGHTINESSTLPANARAVLSEHAQRLETLASGMRESVTSNPASMPQEIEMLSQEEQSLKDLAQKAGAQAR